MKHDTAARPLVSTPHRAAPSPRYRDAHFQPRGLAGISGKCDKFGLANIKLGDAIARIPGNTL